MKNIQTNRNIKTLRLVSQFGEISPTYRGCVLGGKKFHYIKSLTIITKSIYFVESPL